MVHMYADNSSGQSYPIFMQLLEKLVLQRYIFDCTRVFHRTSVESTVWVSERDKGDGYTLSIAKTGAINYGFRKQLLYPEPDVTVFVPRSLKTDLISINITLVSVPWPHGRQACRMKDDGLGGLAEFEFPFRRLNVYTHSIAYALLDAGFEQNCPHSRKIHTLTGKNLGGTARIQYNKGQEKSLMCTNHLYIRE